MSSGRDLLGDGHGVRATMEDGEVTLSGALRRRTNAELLPRVIRRIPGVVGVRSKLTWSEDG